MINLISKKSPSKKEITVDATSMAGTYGYTNNTLFIAKKLSDHASLTISGQYSYNQGADYTKLYKDDTLFNTDAYRTGTFNTIFGSMTPKTPVNSKIEMPLKAYNLYASLHIDDFSLSVFRNYVQTPTFYEENPNNAVYNKDVFMGQGINMASASYKKSFGKITSTTSLLASEYVMNPKSQFQCNFCIPVGYVEVFVNQTRQVNYGGSIQLNYKHSIGGLCLNSYLSVSHTNGFDDYSRKDPDLAKVKLEFISPFMLHAGTDMIAGKFTCSPRLIIMGRQYLTGLTSDITSVRKRQTIQGYALMNVSLRYTILKRLSVFTNVNNALNQRYKSVGFNMDLTKKNTELFYGQYEDPIRIMGGLNFTF